MWNNKATSIKVTETVQKERGFSVETPPKNSLRGNIISMSGGVKWESRTATEAATITKLQTIQQGEALKTDSQGTVSIEFPNVGVIAIRPKSELSVIQTLPVHMVFTQTSGTVSYAKNGSTPISTRVLHLLITIQSGRSEVALDEETETITITVFEGTARVAYNNRQSETTVKDIKAGQTFTFDDALRQGSL